MLGKKHYFESGQMKPKENEKFMTNAIIAEAMTLEVLSKTCLEYTRQLKLFLQYLTLKVKNNLIWKTRVPFSYKYSPSKNSN